MIKEQPQDHEIYLKAILAPTQFFSDLKLLSTLLTFLSLFRESIVSARGINFKTSDKI